MNTLHSTQSFHDRLILAAGDLTYKQLGTITETHPETVRRYMNGHAPSALFLSMICSNLGISGEWLLSGRHPMKTEDIPLYMIKHADAALLMQAMSQLVINIVDKIESVPPPEQVGLAITRSRTRNQVSA